MEARSRRNPLSPAPMLYTYDSGCGQHIYIDNTGAHTRITLASGSPGQQQQSSTQVATGPWTEPPQVAQGSSGLLVRCTTAQGLWIWQIQGTQMQSVDAAQWPTDRATPMTPTEAAPPAPLPPMAPMQPMAPMAPLPPMSMQMGDMSLSLGADRPAPGAAPSPRAFCTQCGAATEPSDRFCGQCGHLLGK